MMSTRQVIISLGFALECCGFIATGLAIAVGSVDYSLLLGLGSLGLAFMVGKLIAAEAKNK